MVQVNHSKFLRYLLFKFFSFRFLKVNRISWISIEEFFSPPNDFKYMGIFYPTDWKLEEYPFHKLCMPLKMLSLSSQNFQYSLESNAMFPSLERRWAVNTSHTFGKSIQTNTNTNTHTFMSARSLSLKAAIFCRFLLRNSMCAVKKCSSLSTLTKHNDAVLNRSNAGAFGMP